MKKTLNIITSEKNSTSLVGVIGLLIVLVSSIGSSNVSANTQADINQSMNQLMEQKREVLSVGSKTIMIGGQEYEIIINPKY